MPVPLHILEQFPTHVQAPLNALAVWLLEHGVRRGDLNEIKRTITELAEMQKELAAAQERTEKRVAELARAQRRIEERVEQLALDVGELIRTVKEGPHNPG